MTADAIIAAAQDFADQYITPHAQAWEEQGGLPREFFARAGASGLLGLEVPASFGGAAQSFAVKAEVCEILAGADFGAAMALINSQNVAKKLVTAAPEIAGAYVPDLVIGARVGCTALTEPHAGSDFAAITTRAAAAPGGWRLTGHKAWIVNAAHADTIVVYAQTKAPGDASGIGAFLIDARAPGFQRGTASGSLGLQSCGAGEFQLNDHFVPETAVLGAPGAAFKAILAEINGARLYVAAMCCGMVEAAIRIAAAWGRSRTAFGVPLHEHQSWRFALAEAATDVAGLRALVHAAAARLDRGEDVQLAAAQAKILAARIAQARLPALIHAMGAEGLKPRYPLGRHLMAAQAVGLVDGSTEMLLERVAKLTMKDTG